MRVRFGMFKGGLPQMAQVECDLSPSKAHERFSELKSNLKCGWCELVAEDETEGGYMEVIDSFDNERASIITSIF